MAFKTTPIGQIINNMKRGARKMETSAHAAMIRVVTMIQRESMKRTPIDTGNLQGSHRSSVTKDVKGIVGNIWVETVYALFVHEAREGTKFKSPWPRGRKFMERAITENVEAINSIFKRWIKVR